MRVGMWRKKRRRQPRSPEIIFGECRDVERLEMERVERW
jgi:hypothetical protein